MRPPVDDRRIRALARELYAAIEPELYRYPAIDPSAFRQKLDAVLAGR